MKWSIYVILVLCLALFVGCGDNGGTTTDDGGEPGVSVDEPPVGDEASDGCDTMGDADAGGTGGDSEETDDVSLNPPEVNEGDQP